MANFRVPVRQSSAQLPGSLGLPTRDANDYGGRIASGLGQLADVVARREEEIKREDDRIFLFNKRSELEEKFRTEKVNLARVGPGDSENILEAEMQRVSSEKELFLGDITDPNRREIASGLYDKLSGKYYDHVATYQIKQRKERIADTQKRIMHNTTQEGIDAISFQELDSITARLDTEIDDPIARQKGVDETYKAWFANQSNIDSKKAMETFKENRDFLQSRLGGDISLIEDRLFTAEKERIRILEKEETESRQRLKDSQYDRGVEHTLNLGTEKEPTLVTLKDDLRNKRISQKQYDGFVEDITNPPVKNFDAYQSLYLDITENPSRELYSQISKPGSGLSVEWKKELTKLLEKNLDEEFNGKFKEGIKELEAVIFTKGRLAQLRNIEEEERLNYGKKELFKRLDAGEEYQTIIEDMKPRYRTRPKTIGSIPTPTTGPKPMNISEVMALQRNLAMKYDRGEISKSAADREVELLEQYKEIYTGIE